MPSIWRTRRPRLAVAALLTISIVLPPIGRAGQKALPEYTVKAAFLLNFASYTTWPESTAPDGDDTLLISILGEDPFGPALDQYQDRRYKGRKIRIRRLATLGELETCHILFVSPSENEQYGTILQSLRDAPVLTVGEERAFVAAGGMIQLFLSSQKVRFEVNLDACQGRQLKLSSQLLKLARIYEPEETP